MNTSDENISDKSVPGFRSKERRNKITTKNEWMMNDLIRLQPQAGTKYKSMVGSSRAIGSLIEGIGSLYKLCIAALNLNEALRFH